MIKTLIALALATLLAAPAFADEWDVDSAPKPEAAEKPEKSDKPAGKQRGKPYKGDAQAPERPHIGSYFGNGDEFVDSGAPEATTEPDQQPAPDDLLSPEAQEPAEAAQPADVEPAPTDETTEESVEPAADPTEDLVLSDEPVAETAPEAAPATDDPTEPVADAPAALEAPPAPEAGLEHYSSYPAMKGRGKAKGKHRARRSDDSEDAPNLAETATGDEPASKARHKTSRDDPSDW